MLWRERAPEVWDTGEPYLDLALAVTLRARQDLMEAAKRARVVLDETAPIDKRRKAYRSLRSWKPETALWYFAASPVWHLLCAQTSRGEIAIPSDVTEDMAWVREALRVGGALACDRRTATSEIPRLDLTPARGGEPGVQK